MIKGIRKRGAIIIKLTLFQVVTYGVKKKKGKELWTLFEDD